MPINPDAVGTVSDPHTASWSSKDCLIYALGVGAGVSDPTGFELELTTENTTDVTQRVLPTFPVVVGGGLGGLDKLGSFNFAMLVHGEQSVTLHRPLPVEGSATSTMTITGIYDKGSGAVVAMSTDAVDAGTGDPLWTTTSSVFIRGEGGFGGDRGPAPRSAGRTRPDSPRWPPVSPSRSCPGDELTIKMWKLGDGTAHFTTATPAGTVIDAGRVSYRES